MLPQQVIIREVGLRDGLQAEQQFIPTESKLYLANALAEAGLQEIEVTSFVSARAVPQLRDAAELVAMLGKKAGVTYSALVVNARGAADAIAAGVAELQFVVSCSETHSRSNVRMAIEEALGQAAEIAGLARASGVTMRTALATTFGCPFEGDVPFDRVFELVGRLTETGTSRISLADTAGMANPRQVYDLCKEALKKFPGVEFSLHLHDTRGLALACVLAGISGGITVLESSIGGLGGCPFIPLATGNIATEDLVYMLHAMGIETGLEWQKLMDAALLAEAIIGRPLGSRQLSLARNRCQGNEL